VPKVVKKMLPSGHSMSLIKLPRRIPCSNQNHWLFCARRRVYNIVWWIQYTDINADFSAVTVAPV